MKNTDGKVVLDLLIQIINKQEQFEKEVKSHDESSNLYESQHKGTS